MAHVEHDGIHECLFVIGSVGCGSGGCRRATRRVGEAPATIDAWHAAIQGLSETLRLRP